MACYDLSYCHHPKPLGLQHDKPGLMTGVSDAFLISELQFAAALTKEEEFVLHLGIRSAEE